MTGKFLAKKTKVIGKSVDKNNVTRRGTTMDRLSQHIEMLCQTSFTDYDDERLRSDRQYCIDMLTSLFAAMCNNDSSVNAVLREHEHVVQCLTLRELSQIRAALKGSSGHEPLEWDASSLGEQPRWLKNVNAFRRLHKPSKDKLLEQERMQKYLELGGKFDE